MFQLLLLNNQFKNCKSVIFIFYLDDENKSMGSNEDVNSLNRYNDSKDQILMLEEQYNGKINNLETKITDLIR